MAEEVGIFHLVRAANDLEPFEKFIASLRRAHAPRVRFRLVLILKGFGNDAASEPYVERVKDLPVDTFSIDDSGYDISAYFKAAAHARFPTLAFFNSFCEIVDLEWFEHLYSNLHRPGVGLVGATGSLESVVRNHRIYGANEARLGNKLAKYGLAAGLLALFPPFPNPHVRTNAFMIRRDDFLATRRFPIGTRLGALCYESGWLSLTRQIQKKGLQALVVDRQGHGLPPEKWATAGCFRSGDQQNVMVRDNRIREFELASDDRKRLLMELAFGRR